jgi:tRNA (guanine-N7-)-methyltransferase
MGRNKLSRFAWNAECRNLVEPGKEIYNNIKGGWNDFLGNKNKITLELGCGGGEYTTGLAPLFPNQNFIGVDVKGSRMWNGSTIAVNNNYQNVAFLRAPIRLIRNFFDKDEVESIWITFPDPKPRDRDEKNRLSGPEMLSIYKDILVNGGWVNFKTDNRPLFDFTLENLSLAVENSKFPFFIKDLSYTFDLYDSDLEKDCFGIKTTYEKKFLEEGLKINYLRFRLFSCDV